MKAFFFSKLLTTSDAQYVIHFLRQYIKVATTYKALERFGKFKTFDDVTLQHIYQFDLFIREEQTCTMKGKPIIRSQAAIHNYHKRFKSYVSEAFRLGLIKENPYERFQDKRGEKSDRPHLTEA